MHRENIKLYDTSLRKQKFSISPIQPKCLLCGSEIVFNHSNHKNIESKVIVLTGTCASGKSSTAEMLKEKYRFEVIDGDCVLQVVKHKLGSSKIEYNELPVYEEIKNEIDILLALNRNIVISHVITSQDIDIYRKIFEDRKLKYKIFLLHPQYFSAVERSKTRNSHTSITPEEWIKYFYDELSKFVNQDNKDIVIFDNTHYSVEESADKILEEYNR